MRTGLLRACPRLVMVLSVGLVACASSRPPVRPSNPEALRGATASEPPLRAPTPSRRCPPAGSVVEVRPDGVLLDGAPLCPPGVVCASQTVLVPLRDGLRNGRVRSPVTVVPAPEMTYGNDGDEDVHAFGNVLVTLGNARESRFLLRRQKDECDEWAILLRETDEHAPTISLRTKRRYSVAVNAVPLDATCERPEGRPESPRTLRSLDGLASCAATLGRNGPLASVNVYVARGALVGELFEVLGAFRGTTQFGLSTPM